ncbi:MAG: hypothetical protein JKY65_33500 [Planctomycetes bacterium]|nr:hypothetical protein [Planctomycetota bacterium]
MSFANVATVRSKNFAGTYEAEHLRKCKVDFYALLEKAGFVMNGLVPSDTKKSDNLTVKFYKGPGKNTNYSKIKNAVKNSVKQITSDPAFVFPGNELSVFCAEESDLSLGYLYQIGMTKKVAIALGKTAVQDAQNQMCHTVAMEVHTHYKPAYTINAQTKRIQTTATHELGHVIHQIQNLWKYVTLGNLQMLGAAAVGLAGQENRIGAAGDVMNRTPDKLAQLQGLTAEGLVKFIMHTQTMGKGVSYYAAAGGLNEFVAETFSALVMGVPIGSDHGNTTTYLEKPYPTRAELLAAYVELGGPMPTGDAIHTRKVKK